MVPSDFAGIFSRYFVIGFFLPIFFLLLIVAHIAEPAALPSGYRTASTTTQVVILGGTSVLGAMLFSGFNYYLLRILEGYPFQRFSEGTAPRWLTPVRLAVKWTVTRKIERWRKQFAQVTKVRSGPKQSPTRTRAAERLDTYFPRREDAVLPTRFGNAMRATEHHPTRLYGLDGVAAWPRIEPFLTEGERESLTEAETNLSLFVNLTFLAFPAGVYLMLAVLTADSCVVVTRLLLAAACLAAGAVLTYVFYRAAVGGVVRWGEPVRAAFDLHRLEVYEEFGLRSPSTNEAERSVAKAVNRSALFGEELPDRVRRPEPRSKE